MTVLEQVAEHFVEILALACHEVLRRDVDLNIDVTVHVQSRQSPFQSFHAVQDAASCSQGRPGSCGSCLCEVIVHLLAHSADVLHDRIRKCDESPDACFLGFPGQECQWSCQCVREVPGRSLGLANRSFALLQKIIQVVHQRLHFAGICALQASRPAPNVPVFDGGV